MRLSSSSLVMASASTSCSVRSAKRFTEGPFDRGATALQYQKYSILKNVDLTPVRKALDKGSPSLEHENSSLWANTAFAAYSSRSSGGACIFTGGSRALRRSASVPWLSTAPAAYS